MSDINRLRFIDQPVSSRDKRKMRARIRRSDTRDRMYLDSIYDDAAMKTTYILHGAKRQSPQSVESFARLWKQRERKKHRE